MNVGLEKGAGQPGVPSECVGITSFRVPVPEYSCLDHEKLRHVIQQIGYRYNERLKVKTDGSKCLTYSGL